MNYKQFIQEKERLGIGDVLPPYFYLIDDEGMYSPGEIAELISVSHETVRRWCRGGKITTYGIGHYKIQGSDFKQFMFEKIRKRLDKEIKELLNME